MNKMMKVAMSIIMSFAMVVCMASTEAGAKAVSAPEDGISPQNYEIGQQYSTSDGRMKIVGMFISQNKMVITIHNLKKKGEKETDRYVHLYVSTSSKTFAVRKFNVKKNSSHSETYSVDRNHVGKITIEIYPHVSSDPKSGFIDPLKGIWL